MNSKIPLFVENQLKQLGLDKNTRINHLQNRNHSELCPVLHQYAQTKYSSNYNIREFVPQKILSLLDPVLLDACQVISAELIAGYGRLHSINAKNFAIIPCLMRGQFGYCMHHQDYPVIFINEYYLILADLFSRSLVNTAMQGCFDQNRNKEIFLRHEDKFKKSADNRFDLCCQISLEMSQDANDIKYISTVFKSGLLLSLIEETVMIDQDSDEYDNYENFLQDRIPSLNKCFLVEFDANILSEYYSAFLGQIFVIIGHECAHLMCNHAERHISVKQVEFFRLYHIKESLRFFSEMDADVESVRIISEIFFIDRVGVIRLPFLLGFSLGLCYPHFCDQKSFALEDGFEQKRENILLCDAYFLDIRHDVKDVFSRYPTSRERVLMHFTLHAILCSFVKNDEWLIFCQRYFSFSRFFAEISAFVKVKNKKANVSMERHPFLAKSTLTKRLELFDEMEYEIKNHILRAIDVKNAGDVVDLAYRPNNYQFPKDIKEKAKEFWRFWEEDNSK